jgi:hypothetical protein
MLRGWLYSFILDDVGTSQETQLWSSTASGRHINFSTWKCNVTYPVAKVREEDICIILEEVGHDGVGPSAQILQRLGEVPVINRNLKQANLCG